MFLGDKSALDSLERGAPSTLPPGPFVSAQQHIFESTDSTQQTEPPFFTTNNAFLNQTEQDEIIRGTPHVGSPHSSTVCSREKRPVKGIFFFRG